MHTRDFSITKINKINEIKQKEEKSQSEGSIAGKRLKSYNLIHYFLYFTLIISFWLKFDKQIKSVYYLISYFYTNYKKKLCLCFL